MFYSVSFIRSGRNADQRKIVEGELQFIDLRGLSMHYKNNLVIFSKVKLPFLPIN